MIRIFLGLIIAFILTGMFMSGLEWLGVLPRKRTTRYCYKKFLGVLKERDLYKHTFPKMSYKQIVNFYELPEANVEGCLMDSAISCLVEDDEDGVLILYTKKEDYLNSLEIWINNRREREKNGIILFVPKSYRDYAKLYDYFYNKGKKQKEDEITNAQLESLRYLKTKIHKEQYKSEKALKECQEENTRIASRITNKNSVEEDRNLLKLQYKEIIREMKNSAEPLTTEERRNLMAMESCLRTFEIAEVFSKK